MIFYVVYAELEDSTIESQQFKNLKDAKKESEEFKKSYNTNKIYIKKYEI